MSSKRSQFKGLKRDGQHVHPPNGSSSCQRSPVKPTVFDLQRNTRDDTAEKRIECSAVSSNVDEQSLWIGVSKVNVPKDANLIRKDDPIELRDEKEHMDMALVLALALSLQEHQKAQNSGQQRGARNDLQQIEEHRGDDSEAVARVLQDEYDLETVHLEEETLKLIEEEEDYSDLRVGHDCTGISSIDDSEMVARALQAKYDAEIREIEKQTHLLKVEEHENASHEIRLKRPASRDQHKRNRHSDNATNGADSDNEFRRLVNPSPLQMFRMPGPEDEVYQESLAARNDAVHHIITGANASPPRFQQDESAAFPNADDDLTYEQMVEMPDVSRGLSKKARAQLPTETYKRNAKKKSDECPVCMEKYIDGVLLTTLPCFHSYHSKCINKWLKDHDVCPVCRLEIKIKS